MLKKARFIWPIVLFPYHERSHTATFTGRRFIRDVRFGVSFARLYLSDRRLCCRLIFPPLLIFEVELSDVLSISKRDKIIEVRFSRARLGWLTRFALSNDPAIPHDLLLLNLEDECDKWYNELITYCKAGSGAHE